MRKQRLILYLALAGISLGAAGLEPRESQERPSGGLGELQAGAFLAASRSLRDPNFAETVIFLIEAGEEGAMGVIVNRPTGIPIAEALPEVENLEESEQHLFSGGPVEPQRPIFLARTRKPTQDSRAVLEDEVFLLTSPEAVKRLFADPEEKDSVRVFAGYAGWAPGQLEAEIARGDWHVLSVGSEWIFGEKSEGAWEALLDLVFQLTA